MKRDTNDSLTQQDVKNQTNLIISLVNAAVLQTDGIAKDMKEDKKNKKSSFKNIHVSFSEQEVTVDVHIDVIFGFSVPTVACELQEKIIRSIQENTNLTVNAVNIHVSNAIFL